MTWCMILLIKTSVLVKTGAYFRGGLINLFTAVFEREPLMLKKQTPCSLDWTWRKRSFWLIPGCSKRLLFFSMALCTVV